MSKTLKMLTLLMCAAIIVILEIAIDGWYSAMKTMFATTNPFVAFILLIFFTQSLLIAKKELAGVKNDVKKMLASKAGPN